MKKEDLELGNRLQEDIQLIKKNLIYVKMDIDNYNIEAPGYRSYSNITFNSVKDSMPYLSVEVQLQILNAIKTNLEAELEKNVNKFVKL